MDNSKFASSARVLRGYSGCPPSAVLVDESFRCCVSDFGMARLGNDDEEYVAVGKLQLPVRWTPKEVFLDQKYSHSSDVYSFGVVLYEIFSQGGRPWKHVNLHLEVQRLVIEGAMLECPERMPKDVCTIMKKCLDSEASKRPTFAQLFAWFAALEERVGNANAAPSRGGRAARATSRANGSDNSSQC
eukprot:m.318368 g.318368  ORF g.318368 m.318368 type:complete len:187 (-) comp19698_c0_seq17:82-642(-)